MEIAAAPEVPSRHRFVELAHACGFALAGVAPVRTPGIPLDEFAFYQQWAAEGLAGPMGYLTDHRMSVRSDPRQLLGSARSVLCLGMLYNTELTEPRPLGSGGIDPATALRPIGNAHAPAGAQVAMKIGDFPAAFDETRPNTTAPSRSRLRSRSEHTTGRVSRYAWGSGDYHDVLRNSLEGLAEQLRATWGDFEYRVCVDTAPLLERGFARAAGLGWIGRNTCLINEPLGSWFFLGEILISLELPADSPPPDRCGTCTRCIDACPTQALVPVTGATVPEWQLDARLCISTLTIEQKGATPEATRWGTGDHLFGCDICQEVCPWNQHSPITDEPAFQPLNARLDLAGMAALTREEFRSQFRSTPVWRTRFEGWMRNVATVMGNSGYPGYIEPLQALAGSGDPGTAAHAEWALKQLEQTAPASEPGLKEQA